MNKSYKLNKNIKLWFSACKHEYAIGIFHRHGTNMLEIPFFSFDIFAIAIFGIHIGITIYRYYYEQ